MEVITFDLRTFSGEINGSA